MKVRKLALVVAAACTWSAAAFAIVQEGGATLTEGGKPIGEGTVKLVKVTLHQPATTSQPRTSPFTTYPCPSSSAFTGA